VKRLGPRSSSLFALGLVGAALLLQVLLLMVLPAESRSFSGLGLLLLGPAFLVAVRLRCAACHVRIHSNFGRFTGGGMLLLWAVKETCPHCGRPLGW
jgi:uncharacterized membrane protein